VRARSAGLLLLVGGGGGLGVRLRGRRLLELLVALPWAIPATAIAIGLASTFDRTDPLTARVLLVGTFWILPVAYFAFFIGRPAGQTPGKKICNIRVIDFNTGAPIGYGRALGRALFAYWISATVCYLGYLWMLWDREKQTWHDKVCTCVVVPEAAYPVPRGP